MVDLSIRDEHDRAVGRSSELEPSFEQSGRQSLAQSIALAGLVPTGGFRELDVSIDPQQKSLWCTMSPISAPSFTMGMLREGQRLHAAIRRAHQTGHGDALRFYVLCSGLPGVFNLGGDLAYFLDCIRTKDRQRLLSYAHACVDATYQIWSGLDAPVTTIGVLEGDALGGGFELALGFHVLIAERGVKMGVPEVLFNLFPGMGAYSFLSRKIGPRQAQQFILSGRVRTAEELHESGIVDILAEPGQGREAARKFIAENSHRQPLLASMTRVRQRVDPVSLEELRDVTEIWVDAAMALTAPDLRKMAILRAAQSRRMERATSSPCNR